MSDKMIALLEEILAHQVANLGTEHEFYTCYTYKSGEMPEWVDKAKEALTKMKEVKIPVCCVCGTKEGLHKDGWYGYRCDSEDCMCF